jgi:hypothetical protein
MVHSRDEVGESGRETVRIKDCRRDACRVDSIIDGWMSHGELTVGRLDDACRQVLFLFLALLSSLEAVQQIN